MPNLRKQSFQKILHILEICTHFLDGFASEFFGFVDKLAHRRHQLLRFLRHLLEHFGLCFLSLREELVFFDLFQNRLDVHLEEFEKFFAALDEVFDPLFGALLECLAEPGHTLGYLPQNTSFAGVCDVNFLGCCI